MDRVFSHIPGFPDASLCRPLSELTPTDIKLIIYHPHTVMAMLPCHFLVPSRVTIFHPLADMELGDVARCHAVSDQHSWRYYYCNPLRITHMTFV
jgi:hypothetical protein